MSWDPEDPASLWRTFTIIRIVGIGIFLLSLAFVAWVVWK